MPRPTRLVVAAALVVATTIGGATAANAATPTSAQVAHAAADARATASAALAGLTLPTGGVTPMRAAIADPVAQSIHETVSVKVASKRYDIHVSSVGSKHDLERITLYFGTHAQQVAVRRLVRVTVIRHGHHMPLLETTTTFRRFVVMVMGLQSNPLSFTQTHFTTRSAFVAALAHGLAIDGREVAKEYGALLRFVQMSLDIAASLLNGVEQLSADPSATDFSGVQTVQTTAGSGGYTGSVTLTGSMTAFTATATNDTDASVLTESVSQSAFSLTYTVGGKTYSLGLS